MPAGGSGDAESWRSSGGTAVPLLGEAESDYDHAMAKAGVSTDLRAFDDISLDELRRRQTEKWRHFPEDVLPAFVAEMDFPLAPSIRDALRDAVERGETGYAWKSTHLARAFAEFAAGRFDWPVDPANVIFIPDVMVGVTEFLRAAARPGDGVVINPPVYPPFFSHIAEAGLHVVEAPLAFGQDGYALDFDSLEQAFQHGGRFYLMSNPHNPTGLVFSRAELQRIVELAERHDVIVIADEIHAPLIMPGSRHIPLLTLPEAVGRGIAFVSASKGWNIPGLKCAQAVIASEAMRRLTDRMPEEMIGRVGTLGIVASLAAYRSAETWLDTLLQAIDRNRKLLARLIDERLPSVWYRPPNGTYLAWLDCRRLGLPTEPVDFFLERGRVALGPGPRFGKQGAGFVRITLGTSEAILREIVERMAQALDSAR